MSQTLIENLNISQKLNYLLSTFSVPSPAWESELYQIGSLNNSGTVSEGTWILLNKGVSSKGVVKLEWVYVTTESIPPNNNSTIIGSSYSEILIPTTYILPN